MSGVDQRTAAINGDHQALKEYIIARCNVCSSDEFGLTALHYAVWNGHIECVRLLICNTWGVDYKGNRNQSTQIISCLGYTALHLAALDCPVRVVYDITTLLLLSGMDAHRKVRADDDEVDDLNNKTALTIAEDNNNQGFLQAYQDYVTYSSSSSSNSSNENKDMKVKYETLQQLLNNNYCYQVNTKTRGQVIPFEAKFHLPAFLFDDSKRTGNIPKELNIHEYQIKPLIQTGFFEMKRLESIACLNFTKQETLSNKERREKLVECAKDDSFTKVEVSYGSTS